MYKSSGKVVYPNKNQGTLDLLANKEVDMIPAWADMAITQMKQGTLPESIKITQIDPSFTGSPVVLGIPSIGSDQDGAYAFLNYILTPEAQNIALDSMAAIPVIDFGLLDQELTKDHRGSEDRGIPHRKPGQSGEPSFTRNGTARSEPLNKYKERRNMRQKTLGKLFPYLLILPSPIILAGSRILSHCGQPPPQLPAGGGRLGPGQLYLLLYRPDPEEEYPVYSPDRDRNSGPGHRDLLFPGYLSAVFQQLGQPDDRAAVSAATVYSGSGGSQRHDHRDP